jgi:hypothetical protein
MAAAYDGEWTATDQIPQRAVDSGALGPRGTTITVDPTDGVTPAASLWTLELDSELVFVGDAGITESNRASRRSGVEPAAYVKPLDWLTVDADFAWSHARFTLKSDSGLRTASRLRSPGSTCSTPVITTSRTSTRAVCRMNLRRLPTFTSIPWNRSSGARHSRLSGKCAGSQQCDSFFRNSGTIAAICSA